MSKISIALVLVFVSTSALASAPAAVSGACDKEAVSAAKDFAADDGDEACAGKEKTKITRVSNQRSQKESVYTIDVDCGGGTSFTETVILDASCKVLNPQ